MAPGRGDCTARAAARRHRRAESATGAEGGQRARQPVPRAESRQRRGPVPRPVAQARGHGTGLPPTAWPQGGAPLTKPSVPPVHDLAGAAARQDGPAVPEACELEFLAGGLACGVASRSRDLSWRRN